jgi:hypothetical protein
MPDTFVHRLFDDPAFPSLEIAVRFVSLGRYLELLLEFVPHIQDQTLLRFKAEIERRAGTLLPEDLVDEIDHTKSVIEHLIPLNFYGAFVLALFAALERSILDIARYVKERENSALSVADLREQNTVKRLTLYLRTLLRQPIDIPQEVADEVRALQLVRNVLAHASGSLADQPKDRIDELRRIVQSRDDLRIEGNGLVIYAQYLSKGLAAVDTYLDALLSQVDVNYPLAKSAP